MNYERPIVIVSHHGYIGLWAKMLLIAYLLSTQSSNNGIFAYVNNLANQSLADLRG
ncbi:MAG: hypothetical protein QNJ17_10430 [Desulfocapsaceae bacterium]|nr:hypothetical protein [Desulfocapsaceae bacterium]